MDHEHHLPHALLHFKLEIAKLAIDAAAKGPGWCVYIADPDQMRAETAEEEAELAAARERGIYLGLSEIGGLVDCMLRELPPNETRDEIVARLRVSPPSGHAHVCGIFWPADAPLPELLFVDAPVDSEWVAQEENSRAFEARGRALLEAAAPIARRRAVEGIPAGSVFIATPEGKGAKVELRTLAEALRILPFESVVDAELAARKYAKPVPPGSFRLAVVHGGGFSITTLPIADE